MPCDVPRLPSSRSILLLTILLAIGLSSVGFAVPCADIPQSLGKAPLDRKPCAGDGIAATSTAKGGAIDVVGADITDLDAMVETSLATPTVMNTLSALPFGNGPNGSLVQGCDFDASGDFTTLYCIEGSGGLFTVDTATGTQTLIGVASVVDPDDVITGLATDPTSGIMYMVATSESAPGTGDCATDSGLYTLDLMTAVATRVGPIPDLSCVIAAGFDNSGQLYAYGVVNDNLVVIDKATGASTVVGPLGFNANFAQGMDFDAATDTCYLFAYNDGAPFGEEGQLRTCDTTTGATAFVGFLGTGASELSGAGIATANDGSIFTDGFESGDTSSWSSSSP